MFLEPKAVIVEQNQNQLLHKTFETKIISQGYIVRPCLKIKQKLSRHELKMALWLRMGIVLVENLNLNLDNCAL